jgi:hypothetical protein
MTQHVIRAASSAAFACAAMLMMSSSASAVVYVTGSVSADNQNLGYKKSSSKSGSASVEFGFTDYVRIGFTHEQMVQTIKGSDKKDEDADGADNFKDVDDYTHLTANSFDLTLVLYNGEIFAPFLKGGLIQKSYTFRGIDEDSTDPTNPDYTEVSKTYPTYQIGAGLGIRLNRQFSLRLSHMVSPGVEIKPGDDEEKDAKSVLDRKTAIGLSYQIQ